MSRAYRRPPPDRISQDRGDWKLPDPPIRPPMLILARIHMDTYAASDPLSRLLRYCGPSDYATYWQIDQAAEVIRGFDKGLARLRASIKASIQTPDPYSATLRHGIASRTVLKDFCGGTIAHFGKVSRNTLTPTLAENRAGIDPRALENLMIVPDEEKGWFGSYHTAESAPHGKETTR